VPEGRFVIETSWPIPVADGTHRGVVVQGAVFSRRLARSRVFRYEVPLAGRGYRRRRRGGGQPAATERRPNRGASPPRPGRFAADTDLGPRRARAGGRSPGWAASQVTALREPTDERDGNGFGPRRARRRAEVANDSVPCPAPWCTSAGLTASEHAPNQPPKDRTVEPSLAGTTGEPAGVLRHVPIVTHRPCPLVARGRWKTLHVEQFG
jgi:hypothetical protein